MHKQLLGLFSGGPFYLRFNRDRIAIRRVDNGASFECRAVVGIDASNRIASVGDPISPESVQRVNPFDHPRVVIHDFAVAEKLCAYVIRKVAGMGMFRPAPVVLVHPDIDLDGGLTEIEARALREMAEGAGARRVFLHYGRQLTDSEIDEVAG